MNCFISLLNGGNEMDKCYDRYDELKGVIKKLQDRVEELEKAMEKTGRKL